MKESEIAKALALGEDDNWEFKDGRGGVGRSVMETVSAFANTAGGVIVCGVVSKDGDRSHDPVGIKDPQKYMSNFWNALNNKDQISYAPCVSKDIWIASIGETKLVCVRVPEVDRRSRPVYVNRNPLTGTYKRRNSGDYPCTEEEVRQMMRDASSEPQDSFIFDGTSFSDIDTATFRAYRNVFASKRPTHPHLKLDDAGLLTKLCGMRNSKKKGLTAAGILMFGGADVIREAFPNLFLDYYELLHSRSPTNRYDDRVTSYDGDWEPNLFNFFYKAYPRLVEGLRTPFGLDEDAVRKAQTPFHEALREAFINALVHTDYMSRGTILIGKRSDAFVFQNPGRSLTPVHRIVEARHAGEKLSDVRNPSLVGMFFMSGLAERQGTGYPTIFHAWDEGRRHSPRIEEDFERNVVIVTLPLLSQIAPEVERDLQRIIGSQYALLSSLEKDILVEAFQFGETSNVAIQFSRKEHARDIGTRLKSLCDQGWLKREGATGRGRTYRFAYKTASDLFSSSKDLTPRGEVLSPRGEVSDSDELKMLLERVRQSRPGTEVIETIILKLCHGQFKTVRELADAMGRKTGKLRENYISRMVSDGRLVRRYPKVTDHPNQAYRTANT